MPLLCSKLLWPPPHSKWKPVAFQWPGTQRPALLPPSWPLCPLLLWLSWYSLSTPAVLVPVFLNHVGMFLPGGLYPFCCSPCLKCCCPGLSMCHSLTLFLSPLICHLLTNWGLSLTTLFRGTICFSLSLCLSHFPTFHYCSLTYCICYICQIFVYLQLSWHTRMWAGISVCFIPFYFIFNLYPRMCLLLLGRNRETEKEIETDRQRDIDVREKHRSADPITCIPMEGWTHNPGMCPDMESNSQPLVYRMTLQSTEPPGQGCFIF